ncbi:hypothetical protein TWF730_000126 [Orbilia blumenaviensis]|uniref:Uncharacterized protein n=1 Tax=Orbilia blumenaviensis TaxID=1796055 RepID=A0AAV9VKL1_9PEZI
MKATFIIALFVAAAAAAPAGEQPPADLKLCGGNTGKTCPSGEICVGEAEIKGGNGVCVPDNFENQCANALGSVCPQDGDFCVADPRNADCPPRVMDCGNGLCIRDAWARYVGLKN